MNYWPRIILLSIFDGFMVGASVYVALLLRFEGLIPEQYIEAGLFLLPIYALSTIAFFFAFGLYHRMWQYASIGELYGIIKAASTSAIFVFFMIYLLSLPTLPRSVYIISWILIIITTGGARLSWRTIRDSIIKSSNKEAKNALIIGAGDAGAIIAREMQSNNSLGIIPVGFIDDNPLKQKLSLFDIPVLGIREEIPQLVEKYNIEEIIIAMPSASGKAIREIISICRETSAKLRIFQGSNEILKQTRIRNIELEDLLRREAVKMNLDEIASYLKGKKVLVSGAGGSIGSELCRQISMHSPSSLILLENSENNLFEIENELRKSFPKAEIIAELADIRDKARLEKVFAQNQPQVVFHAAAFKHVPMMEKHPEEAIQNNIIGSKNIAEIAKQDKVETFILVSTDKAVNPSSVMGATKRIAEMIIQSMSQDSTTRFAAVRFGNVLGSRGSVIPIFEKQIKAGGPVTVTHPDMTRFFMTIPESVQLIIQAGAMTRGGEIFVLDMGEPVKILDLAHDLINLHGLVPDKDIEIQISGIRPGEKLHEVLFTAEEEMAATRHERIYITDENQIHKDVLRIIEEYSISKPDKSLSLIKDLLPEFTPNNDN